VNNVAPIVHIVDDDASFRKAIARLLRAAGYDVAVYESGTQFLNSAPNGEAGCILIDLKLSDLDGLELNDRLHATGFALPVIFLTGYGDVPSSVRAIKAGAQDFLTKPVPKAVLLESITQAIAQCEKRNEQEARTSASRHLIESLTSREKQVYTLLVRGKLNKQIAYELGTSVRTIKAHRASIMRKLQVKSFAEAVSLAERLGMINDAESVSHS